MAKKAAKKAGRSATRKPARKTGKKIQKRNTPSRRSKQMKQESSKGSLKIFINCKKSKLSAGVFKTLKGMGTFRRTPILKDADVVITDKPRVKMKAIQEIHKGTVILVVPEMGTEKAGVVNGADGKKVRVFHMQEELIGMAILGITLQKLSAHVHKG